MRSLYFSARTARIAASVFAVTAVMVGGSAVSVSAAPRVISQPGTQENKQQQPQQAAPVQRQVSPQQVQAAPVQQVEVVRWIPGAPQAVQPIVVQNVVKEEVVVYETSPGLALASAAGSQVLTPQNVANTFNSNIRDEDRGTLEAAGGAAVAGGVTGAVIGGVGAAAGGAAAGYVGGVGVGAATCAATVFIPPATALAAACMAVGPTAVGPIVGGVAGGVAGAMAGAPAGALIGAQAGASVVPGGRAALDRTIADTTWDLESQARVSQGAEPLRGEKPGETMPSGPEAAAQPIVVPELPVIPVVDNPIPAPAPVPEVVVPVDMPNPPAQLLDVPLPQVPAVPIPGSPFAQV